MQSQSAAADPPLRSCAKPYRLGPAAIINVPTVALDRHAVSASDVGRTSVADAHQHPAPLGVNRISMVSCAIRERIPDGIVECFRHDRASIVRRMAPLASPSAARGNSTACLRPALSNALILAATSSAVPVALRVKTISSLTARFARRSAVGPAFLGARDGNDEPSTDGTLQLREIGSQTLRWREPDSNHRSRSCERLFWALPIGDGRTRGGATNRFRSKDGNACLEWHPIAFPFAEGPRVRIRLPPAASPSLQCTAMPRAKSPALSRASTHRWGRETGWADRKPALSGVFSLTGIDAVPPWGSADYVQRRASRGDNRGWGISSFVDYVVRSLCCSAQSSGRSSSVRLVAVSSTGCRPCKIASTSCGLKKARPTRRRM